MPSFFNDYIRRFEHLHTDKGADRWPAATTHRAPHKPLLLLCVLDLLEEGLIAENRIELTPELAETFTRYWNLVPSGRERGKVFYPFFFLRSERFWHLVAQPDKKALLAATRGVTSASQLGALVLHARLDEPLFNLLRVPESRAAFRRALVETYFDPPTAERLADQAVVNRTAFQYSRELLTGGFGDRVQEPPVRPEYVPAVRDQGFRRAVVVAYDRRCALCGIRILTLDGMAVVQAAHIIPWSVSHDDRPANGMALCPLCHWAFDAGMLAVTDHYTVMTSPQLAAGMNIPAHLGPLHGRGMIRPQEERYWPEVRALAWHRKEIFRSR